MNEHGAPRTRGSMSKPSQWLWFAGLYLVGLSVVMVVAYGIRYWLAL